ncbi:Hexapeptide repeat of succinyl-transferase [Halomicrobium zhouii]|uniref:Hexapeptide repeat of succinyl-transferase n=1 Tax=Halomicrobium zhouii TaxID=767519 RepID=A0A1I6KG17_9EURY|nr:acyltransferase [Halomicrobium zhouii]SFR90147.1 Hexapeptide repeat of succinyl-transferase [Halomicrobium zhouii]
MGNWHARQSAIISDCDIGEGTEVSDFTILDGCEIGEDCKIWRFVNLYGCELGDECMAGSNVEIQDGVTVGDRCRIQSHAFICSRVTIEDDVFVSHGAKFVNDRYPPSGDADEWEETIVREGASIGTNATLLPVEVGENAIVGAGAVVVDDVPPNAIVAGNPAEVISYQDAGAASH